MIKGLVSVILPVYNGEKYLAEAIDSILCQTYSQFELLVIIDGCKDRSLEIAESFQDTRIKILVNETNLGLVGSLNRGLDTCCGEFAARMDQDDISVPHRLSKQVQIMSENLDVAILGSAYKIFGRETTEMYLPESDSTIRLLSFFKSPFCHPSVIIRTSILKKHQLRYNKEFRDSEDWRMWYDFMSLNLKMANLPEILVYYRKDGQSTTPQSRKVRAEQYKKMYKLIVSGLFGEVKDEEIELHWRFTTLFIGNKELSSYFLYLDKLITGLKKSNYKLDEIETIFRPFLVRFMFKVIDRSAFQGFKVMWKYRLYREFSFIYFFRRLISFKRTNPDEFDLT